MRQARQGTVPAQHARLTFPQVYYQAAGDDSAIGDDQVPDLLCAVSDGFFQGCMTPSRSTSLRQRRHPR
jgi:hypothetical protein